MATGNIQIENARIGFRNFEGKEGRFNPVGNRNFCVFLDHDLAEVMAEDGWNIRLLPSRDEDEAPQPYMQVAVSFANFPPKIVLITNKDTEFQKKTVLSEKDVKLLDWADIQSVDLNIRPYNWSVSGKTGTKAYLKAMYVTIVEDQLELKYRDVPDSAFNATVGVVSDMPIEVVSE